jgi:hypothetical protein
VLARALKARRVRTRWARAADERGMTHLGSASPFQSGEAGPTAREAEAWFARAGPANREGRADDSGSGVVR